MPRTISLGELATARSGDKGNHANLGIVARDQEAYELLEKHLTAAVIQEWLANWGCQRVIRYELPNLLAFNFLLEDVLAGGASRSLRIDTQGKLLGTAALEIVLTVE
jgi:hypothetical protein